MILCRWGERFSTSCLHNVSDTPIELEWLRFDIVDPAGVVVSTQFSGDALARTFDSAVERRRIEPTPRGTLTMGPDQRKAISDVFMSLPLEFVGESIVFEVEYRAGRENKVAKGSLPLRRSGALAARLPFEGIWYVAREHSFRDPHKRFLSEAFAYDFLQIGAGGKSYAGDGSENSDYYAYGQKVLAAADGEVVFVRSSVPENTPGTMPARETPPGGNVVVVEHRDKRFSYYAHLDPASIKVQVGDQVGVRVRAWHGWEFRRIDRASPPLSCNGQRRCGPGTGSAGRLRKLECGVLQQDREARRGVKASSPGESSCGPDRRQRPIPMLLTSSVLHGGNLSGLAS